MEEGIGKGSQWGSMGATLVETSRNAVMDPEMAYNQAGLPVEE